MRWTPSGMHLYMPHMHPVHWVRAHPAVQALILAALIALVFVALLSLVDTGIRPEVLEGHYPAYPYGFGF